MDKLIHLLFVGVSLLGAAFAVQLPKNSLKRHRFWQVFSGAFLFALTVTHMLPELFAMVFGQHHYHESHVDLHLVGIFILLGYFFQSIIESFSKGVEHGHLHMHDHDANVKSPILLTVSLFIHGLLDGAILMSPHEDGGHGNALLMGVLIHKLPVAFVLMYQLWNSGISKVYAWVCFLLFSISSPLGLLLGNEVLLSGGEVYKFAIYAFAAITGNFLNITTTIFVESNMGHKLFSKNRIALASGIVLAFVMQLFEVH